VVRTALTILFLFVYFIGLIPYMVFAEIYKKISPKRETELSTKIMKSGFLKVEKISGVNLLVIGEENIPKNEPVLYVGNHNGFFDTVLTYPRAVGLTGYIAKTSIEKVPFLSWWMRHVNCLFLDRDDIRQGMSVILKSIEMVNSGISMCIFPEGTRNKTGKGMLEFHKGSFKIAQRTNCAIIPMTLTHTADVLENHFPFIRPTSVTLEYGKPIYYRDLDPENQKNIHEYVRGIMLETYNKNLSL